MIYLAVFTLVLGGFMVGLGPSDILDTKLYYSGIEARELLEKMSEATKQQYFFTELADLVLIMAYTAFFVLALRKLHPGKAWPAMIALLGGVADLIETGTIISVLGFGMSTQVFDWLGTMTLLKWAGGAMAFLFVLAGFFNARGK